MKSELILDNQVTPLDFKPGSLVLALDLELVVYVNVNIDDKSFSGTVVHPGKSSYTQFQVVPDFRKKAFNFQSLPKGGRVILQNG